MDRSYAGSIFQGKILSGLSSLNCLTDLIPFFKTSTLLKLNNSINPTPVQCIFQETSTTRLFTAVSSNSCFRSLEEALSFLMPNSYLAPTCRRLIEREDHKNEMEKKKKITNQHPSTDAVTPATTKPNLTCCFCIGFSLALCCCCYPLMTFLAGGRPHAKPQKKRRNKFDHFFNLWAACLSGRLRCTVCMGFWRYPCVGKGKYAHLHVFHRTSGRQVG